MRPIAAIRRLCLAAGVVLALAVSPHAAEAFLTPAERAGLDMTRFTVTDRHASFLDVAARIRLLRDTRDPELSAARNRLEMSVSCQSLKFRPILTGTITVPSFYDNPKEWEVATRPLLDFEDMMSNLSGAWIATGDTYFANCLVDILDTWAKAGAFRDFKYTKTKAQAWYALESMIFSAGLAYSTVTGAVAIEPARRETIESWLKDIARNHYKIEGSPQTCCNNHYYRRALYMSIIGVVTGDDEMFREGLRAPLAALRDLDERGAFQLVMNRGWRIIHYQNYSLQYLVTNLQVAYRQGYDLFREEVNGRSLADAVRFLMDSLTDPYGVAGLPAGEQDLGFTNDFQYFSWMEIWLTHFDDPRVARFVRLNRPIYNRGAGGHLTLLFKEPESAEALLRRQNFNREAERQSLGDVDAAYPFLRTWRRTL